MSWPELSIPNSIPSSKLITSLASDASRTWSAPTHKKRNRRRPCVESPPSPCYVGGGGSGTSTPIEGAVGTRPLWPAGGPPPWWCAVQHFSNRRRRRRRPRGDRGRGAVRAHGAALPSRAEPSRGRPGGGLDKRGRRAWLERPAESGGQQGGESPYWGWGITQRGWSWVEPRASLTGLGAQSLQAL